MKLNPDWLTQFAYDHSINTRIEAISVVDKYQKKNTGTDYPENWFIRLNPDCYEIYYPHMTRGVYALTREGWAANRGALMQAFDDGAQQRNTSYTFFRGTWDQYEAAVHQRFARIESLVKSDVDVLARSYAMAQQNLALLNSSAPVDPHAQAIIFKKAELAQVRFMLSLRTPQNDPIGYMQLTERSQEIEDELRAMGVNDFT